MTTVETWLGTGAPGSLDDLVLRYLAAFGPASVRDIQAWCGLTKLREVVDRLGSQLRRFRTEDGAELVDVPDAPLPDPDTPAPVRFLAEYDNVVLSHADRSRVVADGDHVLLQGGTGGWTGTVLVDGLLRATWAARREGAATALTVRPSVPLSAAEQDEVLAEGERLLASSPRAGSTGSASVPPDLRPGEDPLAAIASPYGAHLSRAVRFPGAGRGVDSRRRRTRRGPLRPVARRGGRGGGRRRRVLRTPRRTHGLGPRGRDRRQASGVDRSVVPLYIAEPADQIIALFEEG